MTEEKTVNVEIEEDDEDVDEVKATKMALVQHLQELRKMLIIIVVVVVAAFCVIFGVFCDYIMAFLTAPLQEQGINPVYLALTEALNVEMKVCLLAAIIVTCPVIIILVWRFIKPALYKHEQKMFGGALVGAILLFFAGVVFSYFVVFNLAVNFFIFIGEGTAEPMIAISKYVKFLIGFLIPFGLVFELPIVSFILAKLGILESKMMSSKRKYIYFAIVVLSAILTPPDILSMCFMAVPMAVLFELSIFIAWRVGKRRAKKEAMEAAGGMDPEEAE
ncbi:MAG: twin-arginine translocase subunit TatC [Clostridiales bacterium]|nr:twin-arginine translocase subunit TatC [Clostridiales bacterium]